MTGTIRDRRAHLLTELAVHGYVHLADFVSLKIGSALDKDARAYLVRGDDGTFTLYHPDYWRRADPVPCQNPGEVAALPANIRRIIEAAQIVDRDNLDEAEIGGQPSKNDVFLRDRLLGNHRELSDALANAGLTKMN